MNIKFVFIIILFSLFGLTGTLTLIYNIYTSNKIKKWELTFGIITNAFVSEEMVKNPDSGAMNKMYKLNINIEYIVDDIKYFNNGKTINNFKLYYDKKGAKEYIKNYNIGENIDIMYDKNNPENSMIINQIYEMKLFMNILSLSFFLIGIIGLLIIIKYYKLNKL